MKPEPTIKQGVPWCVDPGRCLKGCDYAEFGNICEPYVQTMAAENEQLRRMVTALFNRRHEKDRLAAEAAERT